MDFPIVDLMDPEACYRFLVELLHPAGLACRRCGRADGMGVQARHRAPVLDYRCRHCGCVFNAYSGTALERTRRLPSHWVLILRGVAQGTPTARLAREVGCDRKHLLELRHRLQELAARAAAGAGVLAGEVFEADEMFQNAGEKRRPTLRPRRSAAAPKQQAARPRHLRERPAAGARRGEPTDRRGRAAGR